MADAARLQFRPEAAAAVLAGTNNAHRGAMLTDNAAVSVAAAIECVPTVAGGSCEWWSCLFGLGRAVLGGGHHLPSFADRGGGVCPYFSWICGHPSFVSAYFANLLRPMTVAALSFSLISPISLLGLFQ